MADQDEPNVFDQIAGGDIRPREATPVRPLPPPPAQDQAQSDDQFPSSDQDNIFNKIAGGDLMPRGTKPPGETSTFGSFARSAERGVLPAVGGLAAAGAGAEVGAEAGSLFGPWGTAIGGLGGGLIGMFAGGTAAQKAQDFALSKAPDSWKEAIGQDDRQQKLDESEHPYASFLGGIAPYALTMRPGGFGMAKLPENATAFQKLMANPITARVFGGAAMGGMELGQEYLAGEDLDWRKGAIATGFGLIFNKPRRLGEAITELGARPVRGIFGRSGPTPLPEAEGTPSVTPEPTIAEAGDAKIMGPGITEEVFRGAHVQSPDAEMAAQETRRTEIAATQPPTPPDLNTVARQMHPELFNEYETLLDRKRSLTLMKGAMEAGEWEAPLSQVNAEIEKMAPDIAAAYRRAADAAGSPVAEPVVPIQQTPEQAAVTEHQRTNIAKDVERQMIESGRPVAEAQAYGTLMADYYTRWSQRMRGALGTPEEVYGQFGPRIQGPRRVTTSDETNRNPPSEQVGDTIGRNIPAEPGPTQPVGAGLPIEEGGGAASGGGVGERGAAARTVGESDREAQYAQPTRGHLGTEESINGAQARMDDALRTHGTRSEEYKKELTDFVQELRAQEAFANGVPVSQIPMPDVDSLIKESIDAANRRIDADKVANREYAGTEASFTSAYDKMVAAEKDHGVDSEAYQHAAKDFGGELRAATARERGVSVSDIPIPDVSKWTSGVGVSSLQYGEQSVGGRRAQQEWDTQQSAIADAKRLDRLQRAKDEAQSEVDAAQKQFDAAQGDVAKRRAARLLHAANSNKAFSDLENHYRERDEAEGGSRTFFQRKKIGLGYLREQIADDIVRATEGDPTRGLATNPVNDPGPGALNAARRARNIMQGLHGNASEPTPASRVPLPPSPDAAGMPATPTARYPWEMPIRPSSVRAEDHTIPSSGDGLLRPGDIANVPIVSAETGINVAPVNSMSLSRAIRVLDLSRNLQSDPLDRANSMAIGRILSDRIGSMRVHVLRDDDFSKFTKTRVDGELPAAIYDPSSRRIIASQSLASRNDAWSARTILHEGLHGSLESVLSANKSAESVVGHLLSAATEEHARRGGAVGEHYGLTDEHEFVSEAFSNPNFQRFLAGIEAPDNIVKALGLNEAPTRSTLWDAFISAVRKVLGLENIPPTMLDAIVRVGSHLDELAVQGHEPFSAQQVRAARQSRDEEFEQRARGKVRFVEGERPLMTLFSGSDPSTPIHEGGHIFLEDMMRFADNASAPDDLKTDARTTMDWLGVNSADDIKTRHHEKFARGFEQYVREGVAPSPGLARVFSQFRDWLVSVYQTIKGLGAPISEEMRGVFDRMLTAEPQRTVFAGEREHQPSLADIHEDDATHTTPAEAGPAADRIAAEVDRALADVPPEILHEIETAEAKIAPTETAGGEPGPTAGAEPRGKAGPGAAESGALGDLGAGGSEPGGEGGGGEPGAVGPGGAKPASEGSSGEPGKPTGPEPASGARNANPLAPSASDLFGAAESLFLDKAGNIRVDNLTSREDVAQAIRDAAAANNDFIGDRRGVITDQQVSDLADALGMSFEKLNTRQLGQAFNAEQIRAARNLLIQSATDVSTSMKKAAVGSDEDLLAYAMAKDRHQMIQAQVAGITAEAGRALRAFRDISKSEGGAEALAVDQFIRTATGKDLYQLRMEARLGAQLDTPGKVSKFLMDGQNRTFGRMVLEYWINGLISGIATHVSYAIGNEVLSLERAVPETAMAAAIGRARQAMGRPGERVRAGEVGANFRALFSTFPAAAQAGVEGFRTGMTTLLPGELARPLQPFQGDAGLVTARNLTNDPVHWSDVKADVFSMIRGWRDGIVSGASLVAAGGHQGAPVLGFSYSPMGQIPDIAYRGVPVIPLGGLARGPGRVIAAIHSFFRASNYSIGIAGEAFRTAQNEGLSGQAMAARIGDLRQNPPPDMMDRSRTGATNATLMGKAGPFTAAVSRLTNMEIIGSLKIPGTNIDLGGWPMLKFIDPFVHIAASVMDQSIVQRTPVGILSSEIRADLAGRNGNIAQDMAMSRMLCGTALAVTVGGLAAEGFVSGSGPSDPKEAAIWRLAGNQAHSVRIGDMWYQTNRLGPMGMLMGISADLYDVAHAAGKGDFTQAAAMLHHAFVQNILDESFMRGPADLIRAVEDPGRYGEGYVRNFLSSFVPYSVGLAQIDRASDPYSRQARTVVDAIKAKIPGLSEELLPRRDIWGEPMPNREALAPGFTAIYETRVSRDPVNQAMLALAVYPGPVERHIRNVQLTDQQYDDYARLAGRSAKMRLDTIIQSPDFQRYPNDVKHVVMQNVIEKSRESARNYVMMQYPQIPRDAAIAKRTKFGGRSQ